MSRYPLKFSINRTNNKIKITKPVSKKKKNGLYPTIEVFSKFEDAMRRQDAKAVKELLDTYDETLAYGMTKSGTLLGSTKLHNAEEPLSPLESAALMRNEVMFIDIFMKGKENTRKLIRKNSVLPFGLFSHPAEYAAAYLTSKAIKLVVENSLISDWNNVLMYSVASGVTDNLREVLRHIPKPISDRPPGQNSFLVDAIRFGGDLKMFELLLDAIDRVVPCPVGDTTPLHEFIKVKRVARLSEVDEVRVFRLALNRLPEVSLEKCGDVSILHYAAEKSDKLHLLKIICKELPSLYFDQDAYGNTPLTTAVLAGNIEAVRYFLSHFSEKTDIMVTANYSGWLPIHFAVRSNQIETTKLLLSFDPVAIKWLTDDGRSVMDLVKSSEMLELLAKFS
jgi:Ankyrin repeats (3 copies)